MSSKPAAMNRRGDADQRILLDWQVGLTISDRGCAILAPWLYGLCRVACIHVLPPHDGRWKNFDRTTLQVAAFDGQTVKMKAASTMPRPQT